MRSHLLIGILSLAVFADLARAESFIAKLPQVGTSVVYEYSTSVDERGTARKSQGTLKLHRLADDSESGFSRVRLVFDFATAANHQHTEFVLKVRESEGTIELASATMKHNDGIGKELPSTHLEFEGLKLLFDVKADGEPVESFFNKDNGLYCVTTTVQDAGATPFGAGKLTKVATREIEGKTVSTSSIQIKSNGT
ncbi:hypothetical protein [Aureliella helgolandensis]|uniref:Uncharacterized protein n=1 Tax=Aureliella helgolandensis TaxID=2527968 RepID=A0A518G4X1_9BACT|nr:hypothetical protein [Aureliella helgolandensis]QDV23600.1 hypothetical protein Q31a_19020 [Aureliella helgolandensis]